MSSQPHQYLLAAILAVALSEPALAEPGAKKPDYTRTEDVVYGRRDGHALTLDVFAPTAKPNGAGIILCVSAGFESNKDFLDGACPFIVPEFAKRGYVVFA